MSDYYELVFRDELYDNICQITEIMRMTECDEFTKKFIDVFCDKVEQMIIDAPSVILAKEDFELVKEQK